MKIYLVLILSLYAVFARSQGLFEEKYDECSIIKPCRFCGDTLPQPPYNFNRLIIDRIHNTPWGYNLRTGKLLFEILIDSTGQACVVSIDDQVYCADMKKDILIAINEMHNWKPAILFGHPINATMVLQFDFVNAKYNFHFLDRKDVPIKKGE